MSIRIIACGVFRDALRQIEPQCFHQNVAITYITPYLHNYPQKLEDEILHQIHLAKKAGNEILCLFGECSPNLAPLLREMGIPKIPGAHCFEMLLGSKQFQNIMDEEPGTYFAEKDLVLNFIEYCIQPLELDDPLMRKSFFQYYTRLAYIRQPFDPDTVMPNVHELSQFLKLKPLVIDADYSELTSNLLKLFDD